MFRTHRIKVLSGECAAPDKDWVKPCTKDMLAARSLGGGFGQTGKNIFNRATSRVDRTVASLAIVKSQPQMVIEEAVVEQMTVRLNKSGNDYCLGKSFIHRDAGARQFVDKFLKNAN